MRYYRVFDKSERLFLVSDRCVLDGGGELKRFILIVRLYNNGNNGLYLAMVNMRRMTVLVRE